MNVLEDFLSSPLVYRAGWGLIHFVWQGLAIALVLVAALVMLRRRSAATRHLAAWAALLAMALCLPVTAWLMSPVQCVRDVETGKSTSLVGLPAETGTGSVGEDAEMTAPLAAQIDLKSDAVKVSSGAPLGASPANRADDAAPRLGERRGQVAANAWPMDGVAEMVQLALPWMVGCWIVGVFALSLLHLGGWWRVRRLGRVGISPVATELDKKIRNLARRMGIDRAFRLLESTLVEVPTVFGWLRPVILVPVGILGEMSPQQFEMILAHESAHVRRHDYLLNLLQTVIKTLLFYHPAVWWVSRRIRVERENYCDDFAVATTGERLTYARGLTRLVELRQEAIGPLSHRLAQQRCPPHGLLIAIVLEFYGRSQMFGDRKSLSKQGGKTSPRSTECAQSLCVVLEDNEASRSCSSSRSATLAPGADFPRTRVGCSCSPPFVFPTCISGS